MEINEAKNIGKNTDSSISTIEDIGQKVNALSSETEPANKVLIVTKKDNLVHDYFHYFECWWDANNCLSGSLIKLPKTEEENTKYWINYTGDIWIYLGNSINTETVNNQNDNDGTYWDLQGMYPFFVGSIARIKERQNELELHIDSIGRRFKAKIPDEFRQSFINNQNVRDAFQAICEFLGVYYICPPSTTELEDEEEEDSYTDKDGSENDVSSKTAAEKKMASISKKVASKSSTKSDKTKNIENTNDEENLESEEDTSLTEEDVGDIQLNGYEDINFDANGSIVHGSAIIETSPDMAQTLLNLTEYPLHGNYEEEGNEYVKEDVEKLLNGEIFEELHNAVMDYGAITIQPKTASSNADMSAVNMAEATGSEEEGGGSGSNSNSGGGSKGFEGVKGVYGKTAAGSLYLTKEAIKKMTPEEARMRYLDGQKRNIYTAATMEKLYLRWWRLLW